MKKVDIIILHYGDIAVTKQCVKGIEEKEKDFRNIILINNNPKIDLKKLIKPTAKRKIINAQVNLGFAAGVNKGIKEALKNNADYVCLLNNDVTIKKAFIKPIIEFLNNQSNAGIAGSLIAFSLNDKLMLDQGGYIDKATGKGKHDNTTKVTFTRPRKVDYLSGCCMIIKREVIDAVGYFDERFFMYYEDVDFCLRAREKEFMTYIIPNVVIYHALSKSIGEKSTQRTYHLIKSSIQFAQKHTEFPLRFFAVFSQLIKFALKMPKHSRVIIKAIKEA